MGDCRDIVGLDWVGLDMMGRCDVTYVDLMK